MIMLHPTRRKGFGHRVRFQRNPGIEAAPLERESILFNPTVNKFYLLNRSAAFIWEQLQSPASAEEIAASLCRSFGGVAETQAREDVRSTLEEMLSHSVIEEAPSAEGALQQGDSV
jgi:hypothetical protein